MVPGDSDLYLIVGTGRSFLQIGQHRRVFAQPFAPRHVLDQHVTFARRFVTEQLIFVIFDWANHAVNLIGFHVHPEHVAFAIFVRQQRRRASDQVFLEAFILGQLRSADQVDRRVAKFVDEELIVRNRDQPLPFASTNYRVQTLKGLGVGWVVGKVFFELSLSSIWPGRGSLPPVWIESLPRRGRCSPGDSTDRN